MAIANYGDLKAAVGSWLNRSDNITNAQIPNFINFAEKELHRNLRIPPFEGGIVLEVKDGSFKLPTDLVEFINLVIPGQGILRQTSIDDVFKNKTSFCRLGNIGIVSPDIPNGTKINVVYYQDQKEMDDDLEVSVLLLIAPELILYTTLKHAAIFTQDEEDIAKYTALAQASYQQLVAQNEQMLYSGSPLAIPAQTYV